ncbi:MAG: cobyrinate a,c-diamide synthase [Gammaproteobacteria bacterium]|nr:cobyrinate a,c-diamide synthase [Gammaproteobacteria bacterium]
MANCPALFIAAPASGQGKSTVTAALARYHRNQGRVVRVFKSGPDFLDPMIHERASGHPVYQLDLWLVGEAACRHLLSEAAAEADLILIEGVMGLYDGTPSSADLAACFGVPVVAVIDATAMAQTFGAIAFGLKHYRASQNNKELPFAGVIANRVASTGHAGMLAESLPDDIPYYGTLLRNEAMVLPERHLGLVQASELDDLEQRLEAGAAAIKHAGITPLPAAVAFSAPHCEPPPPLLTGVRIAIARDAAFAFIYPANLDLLRAMGAELTFFSPLRDTQLPACDALWLPGGYPELHLHTLDSNLPIKQSIRAHHQAHKPLLAECGGMLYLLDELQNQEGDRGEMVGLLQGHAVMQPQLAGLGMQSAPLPEGRLTAHTFHHSAMATGLTPITHGVRQCGGSPGEPIYRQHRLTASYLHLYFASNPQATAALFRPA